jgi:hypothetical protein
VAASRTVLCQTSPVADLGQWRPAVPAGDELVAAAPMMGIWHGPPVTFRQWMMVTVVVGLMSTGVSDLIFGTDGSAVRTWIAWLRVAVLVVLFALVGLLRWRWSRSHHRPSGMAAVLDRADGPVLLVTTTAVLVTAVRRPTGFSGRAAPAGPASPVEGLASIKADGELLIVGFEDGSEATLRQRWPTPGATERVAALAAPILSRRQPLPR